MWESPKADIYRSKLPKVFFF